MNELDQLLATIKTLYEASLTDEWDDALLHATELLKSSNATIALQNRRHNFSMMRSVGLPFEAIETYNGEFQHIDPVIAHVRTAPIGVAYTDWMAIDQRSFAKSRFAADYATRFDMRHCIQAFTDRDQDYSGFMCAARTDRADAYSESDRSLVQALLPHLRQAIQVRGRLQKVEFRQRAVLDLLDRVDQGAFLVDIDLKVTFTNAEGEQLLRSRNGGLTSSNGRLAAVTLADTTRLRRAVGIAITTLAPDPRPIVIHRPEPRRPLVLRVIPVSARVADGITGASPSAFVLVADLDQRSTHRLDLGPIFGLTKTETDVAWSLVDGHSLAEIAQLMRVSIATVRTHLKHVMQKTGARRQAELVGLVQRVRGIIK